MIGVPGRLKKIIKDSGLSLPAFGEKVGVSRVTVSNYRDGKTSPPIDFLEVVCREFKVNPEWLLLGKGDPYGKAGEDPKVAYIDAAVQMVEEAIRETGAVVNDRQKLALVEIIREEMQQQGKKQVIGMLKGLKGGD